MLKYVMAPVIVIIIIALMGLGIVDVLSSSAKKIIYQ